jgi:hypothetical protein
VPRARAVGLVLALINVLFWLSWIVVTPPLTQAYYSERGSRVRRVDGALEFHLITDVDPMIILADRPFAYPMVPMRPGVRQGMLANLPAFLSTSLATALLEAIMLPPFRATRVAAWVGTAVFFVVSTLQWLLIGWGATRIGAWAVALYSGRR